MKNYTFFIACLGQENRLDTQEFEDLMAVDSEPVPDEVVDPCGVDTLPADLPGDFNLAMPSPPPESPTLSALDARILELQSSRCNPTMAVFAIPCTRFVCIYWHPRQRLDGRPTEPAFDQVPH